MPEDSGALLLDTHVWIWTVEGTRSHLGRAVIEEIDAASRRGGIMISAITVWEVAMLEAKGRIILSRDVVEWVNAALRLPGTQLLGLTPQIAIESTRLPEEPRADAADRILIASARVAGARLVTRDAAILSYAAAGHVQACDARP